MFAGRQMHVAFGFEVLPSALHLKVLSFLPLVERVRCALVSHSWAALLAEAFFWAELRFDDAPVGAIDREMLLLLCRRAGGHLRALDTTGPAFKGIRTSDLISMFAASEGLGSALQTLSLDFLGQPHGGRNLTGSQEAAALLASCPALTSVSAVIRGSVEECFATLRVLPRQGSRSVAICERDDYNFTDPRRTLTLAAKAEEAAAARRAFTSWAAAEPALPIQQLESNATREGEFEAIFAGEEGGRAAAVLAAALAAPGRGPRALEFWYTPIGATPLLRCLCRALTMESPLTALSLTTCAIRGAEDAAGLAAVLAPGRSRLQSLKLDGEDITAGGGCVLGLLIFIHDDGPHAFWFAQVSLDYFNDVSALSIVPAQGGGALSSTWRQHNHH